MAEKKVKKFETTVQMKVQGALLPVGSEVSSEQLAAVDAAAKLQPGTTQRQLLTKGHILDTDKPVAPSQAEGLLAFDRITALAQRVGALRRDGNKYIVGAKTVEGLTAFRAQVSIDELEAAIEAKVQSK